jgi:Cu/Ag efflux pump CusA
VVIIGGVFTGTILTLFILPLLYSLFEQDGMDPGRVPEAATAAGPP